MRFKADENLPVDVCMLLREAGHDALSVLDQRMGGAGDTELASVCKEEKRILLTLDTDFANIVAYPPGQFHGIVVIRTEDQSKPTILDFVPRLLSVLDAEPVEQRLWILEKHQIRVRGPE